MGRAGCITRSLITVERDCRRRPDVQFVGFEIRDYLIDKVRDRLQVPAGIGEEEARQRALASAGARRFLAGVTVRKVIVVPGRLVNIVAN